MRINKIFLLQDLIDILSAAVNDTFMAFGGNGFIKIYKYEKLLNDPLMK